MHPRAVLNFVYVYLKPRGGEATEEDQEKFDDALYEPLGGAPSPLSLIDQIGG